MLTISAFMKIYTFYMYYLKKKMLTQIHVYISLHFMQYYTILQAHDYIV